MTACLIDSLTVQYASRPAIKDVSFEVPKGVILGIVGPNGAGKSTLLKGMLGLVHAKRGSVQLLGTTLERVRPSVAYMPQSLSLDLTFPVTVGDVVLMGTYPRLGWIRRPKKAQKEAATEALETVGLSNLRKNQIGELSGGQRQRVLLARALVQNPDLLIMDEPFQGVDAVSERQIFEVLERLRTEGRTVIMVHHDLATVPEYCDMVALLNKKLYAYGKTAEVFTPENLEKAYGFPGFLQKRSAQGGQ